MTLQATKIAELAAELAVTLAEAPEQWIYRQSDEPDPAGLVLLKPGLPPAGATRVAKPSAELPANFRCQLCPDRMYPVRIFRRTGRLPALILHFNGPFGALHRRDRSREFVLGDPEEDDCLQRLLAAVGLGIDAFHFQEFTACHFNARRSLEEDWNHRRDHCLSHVQATVEETGVELIIAMGAAAVILFGAARAQEMAANSSKTSLQFGARTLPALCLRSPAALLALERKRRLATDEGREDDLAALIAEEKRIKHSMLAALRQAVAVLPGGHV